MNRCYTIIVVGLVASQLMGCVAALHGAAYTGSTSEVKSLLDTGAALNTLSCCHGDVPPCEGSAPLHCAVLGGHPDIVRLLLDKGARTEIRSDGMSGGYKRTPLQLAVEMADVESVRILLDRGANANATDHRGISVLAQSASNYRGPNAEIANLLIRHGADLDTAIAQLEREGANGAAGARFLERLAVKQQAASQPVAGGISKEELTTLVQAAVEGSAKAHVQAPEQPKPIDSDVDHPAYRLEERSNDFALVVGIGKYSDIPEAQFAERDAEAMKDHLIAEGYPSRNVIQLFGEKAGRSALEKFVENWLPRNVGENSRVFFYFSGHGAPDTKTGEAYLLPWDADPTFLENTGYPIKRLYEKLGALKAKEVFVAMDACFSGAGGRSVLPKGARPLVTKVDVGVVPANLTVFAAASGDQITSTLEDQGHGTFTYYFLKGLGGAAKDGKGTVTAKGLYDYLKPKVQDAARRQNRDQAPVLHAQRDRRLVVF